MTRFGFLRGIENSSRSCPPSSHPPLLLSSVAPFRRAPPPHSSIAPLLPYALPRLASSCTKPSHRRRCRCLLARSKKVEQQVEEEVVPVPANASSCGARRPPARVRSKKFSVAASEHRSEQSRSKPNKARRDGSRRWKVVTNASRFFICLSVPRTVVLVSLLIPELPVVACLS